jgi:hypothetical protein
MTSRRADQLMASLMPSLAPIRSPTVDKMLSIAAATAEFSMLQSSFNFPSVSKAS